MNNSIKLLVEKYKDNISRIKNFNPDYELCDSYDEYLRGLDGFVEKRLELINIILEKKIKLMEDILVLDKMVEEFMSVDKEFKLNESVTHLLEHSTKRQKEICGVNYKLIQNDWTEKGWKD